MRSEVLYFPGQLGGGSGHLEVEEGGDGGQAVVGGGEVEAGPALVVPGRHRAGRGGGGLVTAADRN